MTLQERITQDVRSSLRSGDAERTSTLRMVVSALHNEKIARRVDLTDDDCIVVLRREVKKRREASETYTRGGREDLATKELAEADLISSYLPQQLSLEALEHIVDEVVKHVEGAPAFGAVMKSVMEKVKGAADGKTVSDVVRRRLQKSSS